MAKFGTTFEPVKGRYVVTDTQELYLVPSICCAVAILKGVNNYTKTETLKEIIELVESDTDNTDRYGQTNILVISRPDEKAIRKKLRKCRV